MERVFGWGMVVASSAIEQLLGFSKSDRTVRAYAYLTVSFNVRSDVSDVLDCLLPFLATVVNRDGGSHPIELQAVKEGLSEFGLKIPVYAIQQMLSRLAKRGLLEWNAVAKAYLPTKKLEQKSDQAPPLSLSSSFDNLEDELGRFAARLGLASPAESSTWTDALIKFLRSEGAREAMRAATVKEVLVGKPSEVEAFIVARFIQEVERYQRDVYSDIIKVFTGVLIEDFISNIQEAGNPTTYKGLNVFYDTSVLLRLLGTSGHLLQTATLEMHTTLQSLGCNTYYFDPTASEVQNILDTLEGSYVRGKEIYGETADAILAREITIGQIKDLTGTFQTRLGALNVFPFEYNYGSRKYEDIFQIDERAFGEALKSEAIRNERAYSAQNAANDAHVLALILRLRKGRAARDIGTSKYLFVSKNNTLQRVARNFVAEHVEAFDSSSIPPVFTVSQITTVAWIAATKALDEHKVSRELLANCYAAVQPSEAWASEFARVFEKFQSENEGTVSDRAHSMIFLNTARTTARDESLNQPMVLKKLNFSEIFRQAAAAEEEAKRTFQDEQERKQAEAEEAQQQALEEARRQADLRVQEETERADARARAEERSRLAKAADLHLQGQADKVAKIVVIGVQLIIFVAFVVSLFGDLFGLWPEKGWIRWVLAVTLGLLTVLSFLDALNVKVVSRLLERIRKTVSDGLFRLFKAVFGGPHSEDRKQGVAVDGGGAAIGAPGETHVNQSPQ